MRKLLLILGAARYPHSPHLALEAFTPSHAAFKAAMLDGPTPIVAADDVLDLFDTDLFWQQQRIAIHEWLTAKAAEPQPPAAMILYYIGHGGVAADGSQFFLSINTTDDYDPVSSSISRESLGLVLDKSARKFRKYLIIDSCFAAAAVKNLMGPIEHKMAIELAEVSKQVLKPNSAGLASLCSSNSVSSSSADGLNGLTQFTDGLLEALRQGDPAGGPELSFERLRGLLEQRLQERYGENAIAPSADFRDDIQGPIHQLPFLPNRAERPLDMFRDRTEPVVPVARRKSDTRLQLILGNPSNAGAHPDNFLVKRPQFAASFNSAKGRPNWVSWHLRASDIGLAPRQNGFLVDPLLPEEGRSVTPSLLVRSGYDRGHLCPPSNRSASVEDRVAVGFTTNLIPQEPERNQRLWLGFENFCLELVKRTRCELYIVAGGLGLTATIAGRIEVPSALWKVVLCVPEGQVPGPELKAAEVLAIRMANTPRAAITDWTETIVSVSSLEDETGYVFFTGLPPAMRAAARRRNTARMERLIERFGKGQSLYGIGPLPEVSAEF